MKYYLVSKYDAVKIGFHLIREIERKQHNEEHWESVVEQFQAQGYHDVVCTMEYRRAIAERKARKYTLEQVLEQVKGELENG